MTIVFWDERGRYNEVRASLYYDDFWGGYGPLPYFKEGYFVSSNCAHVYEAVLVSQPWNGAYFYKKGDEV